MPYRASVGVPGRVCAIVMISSDPAPTLNPDLVCRLYGLSSAESQVASLLVDGLDVRAIADGLVITEREVRNHLRTGLKKCGVKRQSELAQLLVSGPLGHLS
jgi:DNA-binding NarL/FixJ family response regulator